MKKYKSALTKGIVAIPKLNQLFKIIAMGISDYSSFRPALQSKSFDKDWKEFAEQRNAFLEVIQEAIKDDRVVKLTRKDFAEALNAILDAESPILRELKDGLIEISFVIKTK